MAASGNVTRVQIGSSGAARCAPDPALGSTSPDGALRQLSLLDRALVPPVEVGDQGVDGPCDRGAGLVTVEA